MSIRQGQEAGTIATLAEMKSYASKEAQLARRDQEGQTSLILMLKPTPSDLGLSPNDLHGARGAGIYKLTDDVSDAAFDAAIVEARAEV